MILARAIALSSFALVVACGSATGDSASDDPSSSTSSTTDPTPTEETTAATVDVGSTGSSHTLSRPGGPGLPSGGATVKTPLASLMPFRGVNLWPGAHSWYATDYGTANAVAMLNIADPANNTIFEVHQYLDGNSGGEGPDCVSGKIGSARLAPFVKCSCSDRRYRRVSRVPRLIQ
jgi:hypothetical protein